MVRLSTSGRGQEIGNIAANGGCGTQIGVLVHQEATSASPSHAAPTSATHKHRTLAKTLLSKVADGSLQIAVLGLGYVGLPLAAEFARHFPTVGVDIDQTKIDAINAGRSYIGDITDAELAPLVERHALSATVDLNALGTADCVIICVPTPLVAGRQPDLSYILSAAHAIKEHLRSGQLVVLESTTSPGTTDEQLLPLFLETGLLLGDDFLLAFSPERVDPGNREFKIADIPKIVGGCTPISSEVAAAIYGKIVPKVHIVSSTRVAETAKLWENTFRAVNIAVANEMSMLCDNLGINTFEVIEAAATKPFGFMPFYPGPGVGGHCIPLDPHYLSWTASKYGYFPRFIALADQINTEMADYVVSLVTDALNDDHIALKGARVLVLGVSYKADVEDVRMSPAIPIIERLRAKRAHVRYHDPYVARLQVDDDELPPSPRRDLRPHATERREPVSADLAASISEGRRRSDPLESRPLTDAEIEAADCVLVITAHRDIDYERVARLARLIVDTRNVVKRSSTPGSARIVSL